MKRFSSFLLLALFLAGATPFFNGVQLSYFDVRKEGNDLLISWQAEHEDGVRMYELHRRTPYSNDSFMLVHEADAHGAGKLYRYRDDQVYKTASELIAYRLEVIYQDGTRELMPIKEVNYTSTAVRRTWGSIKAMFQ